VPPCRFAPSITSGDSSPSDFEYMRINHGHE
jgi:hypothetical protein